MAEPTDYLLVSEVAAICRVPVETARYWIYQGRLPSIKPGRHRLVSRRALAAFLQASEASVGERGEAGGGS